MARVRRPKGPYTANQAGARSETRLRIVGAVSKAIRKREMKNPELTRSAIAEKLGVSRQLVSRILNNAGNWTLDTVGDLIFAYDLALEEVKVVLDEDLIRQNYINPMSQASRTMMPLLALDAPIRHVTGNRLVQNSIYLAVASPAINYAPQLKTTVKVEEWAPV